MCSCLRQSSALSKKLFISNVTSSSKSFSGLSKIPNIHSNYDTNNLFKNISSPKQIQYRYFSLDNPNSVFQSIRSTEANKLVVDSLIGAHDFTGVSWTVTIIAATTIMKFLVTAPCGVYQQYLIARLDQTKVELDSEVNKLKAAIEKKDGKNQRTQSEFQAEVKQIWKKLVVKNNCHPFKIPILFLVQLPFWLLLTVAIRSLAVDAYSSNVSQMENPMSALQFQVGGPFWCKNLSLPDPYYVIPFLTAMSMLTIIEVSSASRLQTELAKRGILNFIVNKIVPNFYRGFAVVFFFIAAASPSGVSLFWASSSLLSLSQNLLLMSPRVRRVLRIPKTPSEVEKPYSHMFNNFVQKFHQKK